MESLWPDSDGRAVLPLRILATKPSSSFRQPRNNSLRGGESGGGGDAGGEGGEGGEGGTWGGHGGMWGWWSLSWQMSQPDMLSLPSLLQKMSRSGMIFCAMLLGMLLRLRVISSDPLYPTPLMVR